MNQKILCMNLILFNLEISYFKTWLIRITINCAIDHIRKSNNVIELIPEYEETLKHNDDDIPLKLTLDNLINTLDENEVKSTFFLVGSWIDGNEELVKEMNEKTKR